MLLLIIALCLCSQISFAEERTITLVLKDGSEVSGEDLGSSNGVYKVRTDSGIVEVKSKDVSEFSQEVNLSYDDLGINKEDLDNTVEKISDRIENYSDNHSEEESDNSDYQDSSYEEESNSSDYQYESDEEESNNSDYQYED